ncbi:unnamed protein product [Bemisia tabaci]|uniref:Tetratricopeptide repeat protein 14 n=1 Tax=Bemisia tabaci TaxID=7038 RepID=A0A9P0AL89_BEMTA|nr:unnamed protein product [Bemisia tabaci]
MENNVNVNLISRSLSFHGQQLQKAWESELGDNLSKLNVPEPDFNVYQQRQKHLSFQDRGKRLKLHDFIVKNAPILFDNDLQKKDDNVETRGRLVDSSHFAVLPPYETFLKIDPAVKTKRFLETLKPGDILIATVTSKASSGLVLKVLCSDGDVVSCVSDANIKAFIPTSKLIAPAISNRTNCAFMNNDNICCEVLDIIPDAEKLICGMKGEYCTVEQKAKLGLIKSDDFPEVFKKFQEPLTESYFNLLHKSVGFFNPSSVNNLSNAVGLGSKHFSHFPNLKVRFPISENATELRQVQAGKWAYRNVADGIEYFKAGKHSEAFQSLNKALQIDPRNIEGLVARGALYANSGSFKKAIDDFEAALKLNPIHQNARKYLGETLVAHGRSFEEENKFEEALKSYERCLAIIPFHEEAQNSIEYLKKNHLGGAAKKLDDLPFPQITPSKALEVKDTLKQLLGEQELKEKSSKKKKKDKKISSSWEYWKNRDYKGIESTEGIKRKTHRVRRRYRQGRQIDGGKSVYLETRNHGQRKSRHSSSSSSSSSSDSSSSESSSSSSSSSDTSHESRSKRKKKKNEKKEHSLSPLSKRMATMDATVSGAIVSSILPPYQQLVQEIDDKDSGYEQRVQKFLEQTKGANVSSVLPPYQQLVQGKDDKESDYEQRVRKFLEQTKGDDDYEEKVRKFLDETAKWKKEQKLKEEKVKKKKKKEKKSRDKGKKKKREEKKKKKSKDLDEKKPKHKRRSTSKHSDSEEDSIPSLLANKPELRKSSEKRSSSNSKPVKSKAAVSPSPEPRRDYEREQPESSFNGKSRSEKRKVSLSPIPTPKEPSKASPPKFKMHINPTGAWSKKKEKERESKDSWTDSKEKRYIMMSDPDSETGDAKKAEPPKKMTLMDKLGGFRMNSTGRDAKPMKQPSPKPERKRPMSRSRSSGSSKRSFSRSRSREVRARQRRKFSRSRSRSSSRSGSRSRSRSRSGSYPVRPRRYRSRSGSRSYSRSVSGSRSNSRSRSPDYRSRMGGRYPRGGRGTYYRPRPYVNRGYIRGRGRGNYFQHRDYHDYRGRGGYRRPRGRGRARFSSYRPRDSRDSRDYRDHDRDSYRSNRRSRSYSDDEKSFDEQEVDDRSPMTKVDEAKERINKMLLGKDDVDAKSEGEGKGNNFVERNKFDGKWGDDDADAGSN